MTNQTTITEPQLVKNEDIKGNEILELTENDLRVFASDIDRRILLLKYIYNVIYVKKRTILIVITGKRGTGKSHLGLKLAYMLDRDWRRIQTRAEAEEMIKERVVFNPETYVKTINKGHLHRGNVLLWDEVGVGASNREWQSKSNIAISKIMQVFRHMGLIIIMTVPGWFFIDLHLREMADVKITTITIEGSWTVAVVQKIIVDDNQPQDKRLSFEYFNSRGLRIGRNRFKHVKTIIANAYDRISTDIKLFMEGELEKSIYNDNMSKEDIRRASVEEKIKYVVENPRLFVKRSRKDSDTSIWSMSKFIKQLKVSGTLAYKIQGEAEARLKELKINIDQIQPL